MSGTYDCPICGKATPHWHEPLDRVRDVCCALRRYGRHEDSCAITRDEWTNPLLEIACTCGLRDELDTAFTLDQKRMTAALNQCAAAEVSSPASPPRRWTEVLCTICGGNGVVKIPGGVSQCPRCEGRCYEPETASPPEKPLIFTTVGVIAEPLGYLEVFFEGHHCLSLNQSGVADAVRLRDALIRYIVRIEQGH